MEKLRAVVRARPGAVAIEGETIVTYSEMWRLASDFARRVGGRGNGVGGVVPISMEKGTDWIVAMLGIWMADRAWMPIDPALPIRRRRGMLRMAVDVEGPSDLAYVIFTSGSTGAPKAVAVTHAGLLPVLEEQIKAFRLGTGSRVLLYHSTSFDAAISDIGTTLLAGATLVIDHRAEASSGSRLQRILVERAITHVDLPPAVLETLDVGACPDALETVIVGGEATRPALVRRWARRVRVVNVYGPTEATICSSLCVCGREWRSPWIGRPVPGMRYRVVGADLRPSDRGELLIQGPGLAWGYLREPELTARKFIAMAGRRFYRTGDLVRRDRRGRIIFVGRVDRQFKLRGLLIEPYEIEIALRRVPGVREAAVFKADGPRGEALCAVLAADRAIPRPLDNVRERLRRSLPEWMIPARMEWRDRLPRGVNGKIRFPTEFGNGDATSLRTARPECRRPVCGNFRKRNSYPRFPLTLSEAAPPIGGAAESKGEHGDPLMLRRAQHERVDCPDHGGVNRRAAAPSRAARRSELEILQVARAVLKREDLTAESDFFAMGGDSLSVMELVNALSVRGIHISPDGIYRRRTITAIAAAARRGHDSAAMSALVLRREARIGSAEIARINRSAKRKITPQAREILLTGATGFLGSRLLLELLKRTEARIWCLVRAPNPRAGWARIKQSMERFGLRIDPNAARRVRVVPGDVSRPDLGLGSRARDLERGIDTVYHCAAEVNMVKPFEELRAANLDGTRSVMRFACAGRRKVLHYASTLSVFVSTDRNQGELMESDDLLRTRRVYGGYAQTKWASEWMLRRAAEAGLSVNIYRFGLLTGGTDSARLPALEHFGLMVRGLEKIGAVPEAASADLAIDITPVDYAAAAMAVLSRDAREGLRTFHIANPRSLTLGRLLVAMRREGLRLGRMSAADWADRAGGGFADPEVTAASLALCRAVPGAFERQRGVDLFQATGAEFSTRFACEALKGSGLTCPAPTDALIRRYVRHALAGENVR